MSLAFIDGAEHQMSTPPLMVGSGGTNPSFSNNDPTTARYGGSTFFYTVLDSSTLRWYVPVAVQDPEVWCGFAFYQSIGLGGTSRPLWIIQGDGTATTNLSLYLNSNGSVSLYRGTSAGTLLGTSATGLFTIATWGYVEVYALINDTTGAYEVRLDGVNILSGSGVDTYNAGTSPNVTVVGGSRLVNGTFCLYDDIYCVTGDGVGASGFQGEIVVEPIIPNGNGNYSQLVGQDGDSTNNYLNVDERPFSTTDYNGSSTVTNKDTYTYSNLVATTGTILGSAIHTGAFKSGAGFIKGRRVIRLSATDYNGSDLGPLSGTLRYFTDILETSPNTSVAWTISEVNGIEAGFEVRSA